MINFVIEHHTGDYRGDHEADVVLAYPVIEGESVEDMFQRVRVKKPMHEGTDYIVIRPLSPTTPKEG